MLLELHVRDLGVIDDLALVLGPGMTALTGETGAGKTLVVEAIELLVGARADPLLVRPGASEARVEGRFVDGDRETVLARAVPRTGRSRAYVDGHLATVAELAEHGRRLVDLHGQHAHQSLLSSRVQREALDRFAAVDLVPLARARAARSAVDDALAALGGDSRARARETDLLRFQVAELEAAGLDDPDEDGALEALEDLLAGAEAHREAGAAAYDALVAEGGAGDGVGRAVHAVAGHRPLAEVEDRLRAVAAELAEAAADLRAAVEGIPVDPDRLEEVRARRRLLAELRRKYGERLSDVLAYAGEARSRLSELEGHDQRVAALEEERAQADAAAREAAAALGRARREAAPALAEAVERNLRSLAMPRARFEVAVGDEDPGDQVSFLLGANPGEMALPLAKVASGGELARACLAARLVLTEAPPTLVFDEVDAGVGGQAALAVGRALAELAASHQVVVVTHLPQVAAFADHQVAVTKEERAGRTVARAGALDGRGRVVELSRMLSGQPASSTAHGHAEELLATAWRERGR
ncbi:MAG TPA: DNA repair protein RecN [Acidimicrobiales bacterium]|nr:DNA repair protein RecN [Acidimicrobiales bacterium]